MPFADNPCVELKCPGCKHTMETTISNICSIREAKCRRCGSALKFKPKATALLRATLLSLELSQARVGKALEKALDTAETHIKK
jgi:DNA-directed RNA polymerase subunit RPC12/RpoP